MKLNSIQAPLRSRGGFRSLRRRHHGVQLVLRRNIYVLDNQVLSLKIIFLLSYIFDIYVIVGFLCLCLLLDYI